MLMCLEHTYLHSSTGVVIPLCRYCSTSSWLMGVQVVCSTLISRSHPAKQYICIYKLLWSFSGFPSVSVIESHGGWIRRVFCKPHVVTLRAAVFSPWAYFILELLPSCFLGLSLAFLVVSFIFVILSCFRNSSNGKIVINLCLWT